MILAKEELKCPNILIAISSHRGRRCPGTYWVLHDGYMDSIDKVCIGLGLIVTERVLEAHASEHTKSVRFSPSTIVWNWLFVAPRKQLAGPNKTSDALQLLSRFSLKRTYTSGPLILKP